METLGEVCEGRQGLLHLVAEAHRGVARVQVEGVADRRPVVKGEPLEVTVRGLTVGGRRGRAALA